MMELKEQVAYLRGLIEGQEFPNDRDGILWTQLINICDLISMEIENIRDDHAELNDYVEAIDEDLGYLEELYYPPEENQEENEDLIEG